MKYPFVSVLIDTYNHVRFIEQAVLSVLTQEFPASDREILVVDDGSTDRTPEIVAKFAADVRLLRKTNGGQASAFNVGIPECRGEIIAFLDGDDWWAPSKLSSVVDVFSANPSVGMVGHGIVESLEDGTERTVASKNAERLRLDSLANARAFRLRRCYFGTSRMTLRATLARRILPIPESIVIEADEYVFTVAAALAEAVILSEPLTHYRLHGANLYLSGGGNMTGLRRKQQAIEALAGALQRDLPATGIPEQVVRCVVEIVRAEANQLRLMMDGGMPWETYRTESTIYRIQHADAPWKHKVFRKATMILALMLPPRWFYAARSWLAAQAWYKQARKDLLPVPGFTKVTASSHFEELP